MTGRKPPGMTFETWVDRQIREAQERGEFDNLPGVGKPIPGLDADDELWWVKQYLRRENLSYLPPTLALRKEVEQVLAAVPEATSDSAVREMIGKIRAALDARRDADLVIVARTDARAVEGLEAAIRRANAYANAGADMLFVEAPESEEELRVIARQVRSPLVINMFQGGRTPLVAPDVLAAMGYRVMIVPSDLQRAAIRAMQDAAAAIKTAGTAAGLGARLVGFDERDALVDLPGWRRREATYTADPT